MIGEDTHIDKTAIVSETANIGKNCKIWHFSHIRDNAVLGDDCIIGDFVYIDCNVKIGSRVKIQNSALIYHGVEIADSVFVGPGVVFTNDKYPRAINSQGELAGDSDWEVSKTEVCYGASIGANSTILPGVIIGKYAFIGSGSVVTKDVPEYTLVVGNPAVVVKRVCKCGKTQNKLNKCPVCVNDSSE